MWTIAKRAPNVYPLLIAATLAGDGSAKDGRVTAFIEDVESNTTEPSGAEGVGADAAGNVFGAVVRRHMLEKHSKLPAAP